MFRSACSRSWASGSIARSGPPRPSRSWDWPSVSARDSTVSTGSCFPRPPGGGASLKVKGRPPGGAARDPTEGSTLRIRSAIAIRRKARKRADETGTGRRTRERGTRERKTRGRGAHPEVTAPEVTVKRGEARNRRPRDRSRASRTPVEQWQQPSPPVAMVGSTWPAPCNEKTRTEGHGSPVLIEEAFGDSS